MPADSVMPASAGDLLAATVQRDRATAEHADREPAGPMVLLGVRGRRCLWRRLLALRRRIRLLRVRIWLLRVAAAAGTAAPDTGYGCWPGCAGYGCCRRAAADRDTAAGRAARIRLLRAGCRCGCCGYGCCCGYGYGCCAGTDTAAAGDSPGAGTDTAAAAAPAAAVSAAPAAGARLRGLLLRLRLGVLLRACPSWSCPSSPCPLAAAGAVRLRIGDARADDDDHQPRRGRSPSGRRSRAGPSCAPRAPRARAARRSGRSTVRRRCRARHRRAAPRCRSGRRRRSRPRRGTAGPRARTRRRPTTPSAQIARPSIASYSCGRVHRQRRRARRAAAGPPRPGRATPGCRPGTAPPTAATLTLP